MKTTFSNQNEFILKLMQEIPKNINEWINQLTSSIAFSTGNHCNLIYLEDRDESIHFNTDVQDKATQKYVLADEFGGAIVISFKDLPQGSGQGIDSFIHNSEELIIRLTGLHLTRFAVAQKLKSEQENSKRKGNYLSSLVHEIKTPLNALSGFSQLLKEPDIDRTISQKYIEILSETSANMISLINYFNSIAEIEAGNVKIVEKRLNLRQLLNEITANYYRSAKNKGIGFETTDMLEQDETIVSSDEGKLRQILNIILTNSIAFTHTGKIGVSVSKNKNKIQFSVKDTGIGISEEEGKRLFDYSKSVSSLIKKSKGSGLGLIIARSYAEMMGGNLWFESKEGIGSQFFLTIPFIRIEEAPTLSETSDSQKAQVQNAVKRILVAEDDNLNFALIKNFLSTIKNIQFDRAMNGKEAVEMFNNAKYDLVVMDIRMPVMDGFAASREIKKINQDIRIIAQTAYSNDRNAAISNGCDDFIAKPFGKQEFITLISSYI